MTKRPSMRKAINDFCRWCIYDPGAEDGWKQQVAACTAEECPLHVLRPQPARSAAKRATK